jgi:hypothetical protein
VCDETLTGSAMDTQPVDRNRHDELPVLDHVAGPGGAEDLPASIEERGMDSIHTDIASGGSRELCLADRLAVAGPESGDASEGRPEAEPALVEGPVELRGIDFVGTGPAGGGEVRSVGRFVVDTQLRLSVQRPRVVRAGRVEAEAETIRLCGREDRLDAPTLAVGQHEGLVEGEVFEHARLLAECRCDRGQRHLDVRGRREHTPPLHSMVAEVARLVG